MFISVVFVRSTYLPWLSPHWWRGGDRISQWLIALSCCFDWLSVPFVGDPIWWCVENHKWSSLVVKPFLAYQLCSLISNYSTYFNNMHL